VSSVATEAATEAVTATIAAGRTAEVELKNCHCGPATVGKSDSAKIAVQAANSTTEDSANSTTEGSTEGSAEDSTEDSTEDELVILAVLVKFAAAIVASLPRRTAEEGPVNYRCGRSGRAAAEEAATAAVASSASE